MARWFRRWRARVALAALMTLVGSLLVAIPARADTTGAMQTYVVLYTDGASSAGAATAVQQAGGTLIWNYSEIGVVIARSSSTSFRSAMQAAAGIEGVAATSGFVTRLKDDQGDDSALPNVKASSSDPLSGLQWDMVQIRAPEAHAVTGGSRSVVVGDIDTGLDFTHPDLAPNVDFANSVSCVGGIPNTAPSAWNDDNGHGTHTAGTIAAAANGIGIVGVAPNVKIAGIKAGNTDGFFFPEAVVCAFVWAGQHRIDVTNNSYFADPWLFNCRNDSEQHAIWKAEQRAIRFAQSRGTVVVAAEGNENIDLSHPTTDTISPDFPPGSETTRRVTNACVVIPVEIPGVIGVTADGNLRHKSYFSSYGISTADVVAPGGDRRFQVTAAAPNGRVLSTYPAARIGTVSPSLRVLDCSVTPCATYAYLQGTSMASPHVAGVAALIVSQSGKHGSAVEARIQQTANAMPCPANPFLAGTPFEASCQGGVGHNSFFGSGEVDALAAVS